MRETRSLTPPIPVNLSNSNMMEDDNDPIIQEISRLPDYAPGNADVSVSITVNLGNFESVKYSLSVDESYSGFGEDNRDSKMLELHKDILLRLSKNAPIVVKECKKLLGDVHSELENANVVDVADQVKRFKLKRKETDE